MEIPKVKIENVYYFSDRTYKPSLLTKLKRAWNRRELKKAIKKACELKMQEMSKDEKQEIESVSNELKKIIMEGENNERI